MIQTEVLIVGGGPAGAACAWRLHQLKVKCLILDRQVFPRSKPCAGWITPDVFKHLETTPSAYPYGLTHFGSFQVSTKGIKFRLPTHQYAIRRVEFDLWLLERAGVNPILHKVVNIELSQTGFIIDGEFQGKYLIGAGGTQCPVRRHFFHTSESNNKRLIIAREAEFQCKYTEERCHLWFFEHGLSGYAWYVPKAEGYLNVGIGASAAGLKRNHQTLNEHWERHLQTLLDNGFIKDQSFNPMGYSYYLRRNPPTAQNGNAFLLGDALGLATRDMGEGIGPAIQSGILAAEAIANQTPFSVKPIPRFSYPSLLNWRK